MKPPNPLPCDPSFSSPEEYVSSLLTFATTSDLFQLFCGGVHVLDFFTHNGGLFQHIVPPDWQQFLRRTESMRLLDLLMRDDLDDLENSALKDLPLPVPRSLAEYIKQIRRHTLIRDFTPRKAKLPVLPRPVSVGMKPKKVHEVTNFADYVDCLADVVDAVRGSKPEDGNSIGDKDGDTESGRSTVQAKITHLVDFGSGQNYLGRTLSFPPYNRHIVAVESRESNINGARDLDTLAGIAEKEVVMRNKKLWKQVVDARTPEVRLTEKAKNRMAKAKIEDPTADLRPMNELKTIYTPEEGKGFIHYISGRLEDGDLSEVITKLKDDLDERKRDTIGLMGVSIHSCGNLSHFGIRSLILNSDIKAIAIVGCCYNRSTEKLGPPTYKHMYMRPTLQAINGRIVRESEKRDPLGFPMSERLSTYGDVGIRLNITARMMACQAPYNWTESESDDFFTRHFFRAILQKMFLDKGVISRVYHRPKDESSAGEAAISIGETPFNMSTNPIIIGSLRKCCYSSFNAYVRGAVAKLCTDSEYIRYSPVVEEKMSDLADEEIARYEDEYLDRKRELSSIWSLMAFSATVVESLMVIDRWLFLREHGDVVKDSWVETVFDYRQSPRNLVVVGVKK
ncbi:Methyltransferase-like protein 25 [Zalerion maritima]|uniref:Methyltransferase-like protein 25 n=1 Tax=Zalerion maritima TaxID=339359 RepID=A0AAD5WWH5_9PEZI|nr:Methyltransferase-like protein 25 [Zalerion maritima]